MSKKWFEAKSLAAASRKELDFGDDSGRGKVSE
jgi:hypothetical protein